MTIAMKMVGLVSLSIISSCLFPPASRAADDPAGIAATVDRAFRPLMQKYDVPGMEVAVTVEGRQFFFDFGVASKEKKTPVTKDTIFELGSISKTFTATLASCARELGKISLDDHPGRFMPQLSGSMIDRATLLDLGTYTAGGLPLQFPDEVQNDSEMVAFFGKWKPDAAPGEQRRYSNPSIGLLGHVTGLAMGGNFADLVESQLFPKLGLGHSYMHVPVAQMDNYAWGYNKRGKPIRVNPGMFDAEAYGIKTNAADMIRFVEENIDPASLDGTMRRAIESTHIGYFDIGAMVQGLGWEQYPYPVSLDRLLAGNDDKMIFDANKATRMTPPHAPSGPTLFDKTGSTNGFGSYVAFVPNEKIGIVMLANKNFPIPARVTAAHAVLEQFSGKKR